MDRQAKRRGVRPGGRFQAARAQPRRLRREDGGHFEVIRLAISFLSLSLHRKNKQTAVESADSNYHRALFPERVMMLFSIETDE